MGASDRIGKRLQGWQSSGAWASPADDTNAEYLLDDHIRVRMSESREGLSVIEGLVARP